MTDHDHAANIARLTVQVATVAKQRDEYASLLGHWKGEYRNLEESLRKSDAQRGELQAMITACEERETQQRERAKKAESERDEHYRKLLNYWSTYGGCSDDAGVKFVAEKEAALHRLTLLEGAINGAKSELANGEAEEAWKTLERAEKCSICSMPITNCVCTGLLHDRIHPTSGRLLSASPVIKPDETPAPKCANCHGSGRWWDTVREAYTPCRCSTAPVDRDASVDAPMLDDERKQLCDKINEWKRRYFLVADAVAAESTSAEQLADVAYKTRQDLAAANETIERLKLEREQERAKETQEATQEQSAHAATSAKLGRAVAALRRSVTHGASEVFIEERNAILADADSKAAGEAWAEFVYLRPEVVAFAAAMERKLKDNEHKGGWKDMPARQLVRKIDVELGELSRAVKVTWDGGPCGPKDIEAVLSEAADVGNFAMMVADVCGALAAVDARRGHLRCARKTCGHPHHDKPGCDECDCMVFVEVDARRGGGR